MRQSLKDLVAKRRSEAGDPNLEQRRAEMLDLLRRRPDITRAFVADTMADGAVSIMLAIRGVGSGQLTIPAGQSDPATLVQLFDELERSS
jgi:hypothetical protein